MADRGERSVALAGDVESGPCPGDSNFLAQVAIGGFEDLRQECAFIQ